MSGRGACGQLCICGRKDSPFSCGTPDRPGTAAHTFHHRNCFCLDLHAYLVSHDEALGSSVQSCTSTLEGRTFQARFVFFEARIITDAIHTQYIIRLETCFIALLVTCWQFRTVLLGSQETQRGGSTDTMGTCADASV